MRKNGHLDYDHGETYRGGRASMQAFIEAEIGLDVFTPMALNVEDAPIFFFKFFLSKYCILWYR